MLDFRYVSAQEHTRVEENSVGCIYDLVRQCSDGNGARFGLYWHAHVRPVVVSYMLKRQDRLGQAAGAVQGYLEKIISLIDALGREPTNEERQATIEGIVPLIPDPDDSLCGVLLEV